VTVCDKSNVLKCPSVCLEIRTFLTQLPGKQLCPSPYTFLARQSYPSQKSFEQRKEMTFDGRLANIRAPVFAAYTYCRSSQNLVKKALHEITIDSQG